MRLININGNIQSENLHALHSWNRSFHYGDGLFETIVIHRQSLPFFELHWNRLTAGAEMLSLDIPAGFTKHFFKDTILELVALNYINGNAAARLTLFREGKGKYTPDELRAGFVIEVEPLSDELFKLNEKGLTLGIYPDLYKYPDKLSNFKTCNSLIYILAAIYKSKNRWDDCVILNTGLNICEATSSNLFLVKQNQIITPALQEGCVDGVMRKFVIELAQNCNLTVSQASISSEELREADEIFLTNAINGIRWVGNYGSKQLQNKVASELSEKLRQEIIV